MILLQILGVAFAGLLLWATWSAYKFVASLFSRSQNDSDDEDEIAAAMKQINAKQKKETKPKNRRARSPPPEKNPSTTTKPLSKAEQKALKREAERKEAEQQAALAAKKNTKAAAKKGGGSGGGTGWMTQEDHTLLRESWKAHKKPILSLACSPDGQWIATCSADRTILLHHQSSDKRKQSSAVQVNTQFDHATQLRFSSDPQAGIVLACVLAEAEKVSLRALQKGGGLSEPLVEFESKQKYQTDFLRLSGNGRTALTGDVDTTVLNLHGVSGGTTEATHRVLTTIDTKKVVHYDIDICASGRFMAVVSWTDCRIWEVKWAHAKAGGGFEGAKPAMHLGDHKGSVVRFNADGTRVVIVGKNDAKCRMFDLDVRYQLSENPKLLWESEPTLEGREASVLEISPDEQTAVIADHNTLTFVDLEAGQVTGSVKAAHTLAGYDGSAGPRTGLAWLSDSSGVATSGTDRQVRIWNRP